ncbi:MAG: rod shape-determining protein MreC [Polymorphobacter sp.]
MDWTPAPRRSSAMRREQNLALVGAVVSGAVIATGLVLVARVNPDSAARMRGVMLDITTPVWSVVRAPFDGVGRAAGWASDYLGAVDRNRRLETELAAARAELQRAAADRQALAQLKRLGGVHDPARTVISNARIVSATSGSVVRSAMIAVGRSAGVGPGLPVIGADGLIGRVVEAGSRSARVLLLTDPASRIPVTIVRTGQSALAVGTNRPRLELRDRVGADTPLQIGDRLVTSGDGGIFPPGVPVGSVVSAAEPILIRPAANPVGAAFVTIEAAFMPLPVEAAEPRFDAPVPIEARRSGAAAPKPAPRAPLQ